MFNIGGQGQYFVGLSSRTGSASSLAGMSPVPHILFAIVGGTLAGAAYAGIAGVLKATVGAHEVISTIMLNWIAFWIGSWLLGVGGPLQNTSNPTAPSRRQVAPSARLPDFWGVQGFQGVHIGFFIALARARRLLGRSSTGRRSGTRCGRWASIPTRRRTAAST